MLEVPKIVKVVVEAYELGAEMTALIVDQSEWSQNTFGSDAERGPIGPLKHLEKEARECQAAVGTSELKEELADCLIIWLDAIRRSGFNSLEMIKEAQAKMVKNRARSWPVPVANEPVEHIR